MYKKNVTITRSDNDGKCIAFEFELYGATFTCRKQALNSDKVAWTIKKLTPYTIKGVNADLDVPMLLFEQYKENVTLEKLYKQAVYTVMAYTNDLLGTLIDVVDEAKEVLGLDNTEAVT